MRDVIEHANLYEKELYIVSVDQSKAFDRISHKYIFKLLDHLDLGDFINNNIKRLYDQSYAHLFINRMKSDKIMISSGLKQGCALSMFLYTLAIEELIHNIILNGEIKGYEVNITKTCEVKINGYADNIDGILNKYDSIKKFFNEINKWCELSGAKINTEKTKILAINSIYNNYEGVRFVNKLKALGIEFNKYGIDKNNIKTVKVKIQNGLHLWDSISLKYD